ncbi:MAG: LysR substrate-binding domain-containing protein, partial [Polyangiaceae bacterium]|nr:LysR substrate-binding domain-containing protein [Polyangiaceae bacterium]
LLDGGDCDLVLGVSFDETTGLRQQVLFTEEMVFTCRKGHPQVRRRISLDTYLRLRHVVISLRGGPQGSVDALLMAQGRRREVALLVPHFLAGLKIVERSDLVITAPRRLVEQHSAGLQAMKPPLEIPGFTVRQVWHERMHSDPAHLWLRKQFFEVTAGLRGGRVRRSGSGRR